MKKEYSEGHSVELHTMKKDHSEEHIVELHTMHIQCNKEA